MKYFTSDWHLGDDRIGVGGRPNLFYRPFKSVDQQDWTIINNMAEAISNDRSNILYMCGDVVYSDQSIDFLRRLRDNLNKVEWILVKGNYDDGKEPMLSRFFDKMVEELWVDIGDIPTYVNHYPVKCVQVPQAITGHIHGLWKVQSNMVNVSVDAWHFMPVSEKELEFAFNAINKFYDKNVFPHDPAIE